MMKEEVIREKRLFRSLLAIVLMITVCLLMAGCSKKPKEEESRPEASTRMTVSRKNSNLVMVMKAMPGPGGTMEEWGPSLLRIGLSYVDFEVLSSNRSLHSALLDHYENLLDPEIELRKAKSISSVRAEYLPRGFEYYDEGTTTLEETDPLFFYQGRFNTKPLRAQASAEYEFQGEGYWCEGTTWYLEMPTGIFVEYGDSSGEGDPHSAIQQCIKVNKKQAPSLFAVPGMSEFLKRLPEAFSGTSTITTIGGFSRMWYLAMPRPEEHEEEFVLIGISFVKTASGVQAECLLRFETEKTASVALLALHELFEEEGSDTDALRRQGNYIHISSKEWTLPAEMENLLMSLPDFW